MFRKLIALLCMLALGLGAVPALGAEEAVLSADYLEFTQLGQTAYLAVLADGQEAAGAVFTSSDENVARVDHGVVMAMGDGSAVITAAYAGTDHTCVVKVTTGFSVEIAGEDVISLRSGETASLTAAVTLPTIFDTIDSVAFSSSDEAVAVVDAEGKVTAVGPGICVLAVTTQAQKTTETRSMMGTFISTAPAQDSVVVLVDNEFTAEKYPQLPGLYAGMYDWQGFTKDLKKNAPVWTEDQFLWIRALETLELRTDGTFRQQVLNAQRKGYAVDASQPGGDTYEEQAAKYQKCYVYNRFTQKSDELSTENRIFHDVVGMTEDGINNFAETGVFAVLDGQVVLFYQGEIRSLGPAAENAWLENAYVPFDNMVPMSENMAMKLEKQQQNAGETAEMADVPAAEPTAAVSQAEGKTITGTGSMTWHGDETFTAIVDVTLKDDVIIGITLREGSHIDTGASTFRLWAEGKEQYLSQYAGKTTQEILDLQLMPSENKDHYDGGKIEGAIDAVTGATASSTTIAMAVKNAVEKDAGK